MQLAQGLVASGNVNRWSELVLITSRLKNQIDARIKSMAIRSLTNCKSYLLEVNVRKREHMLHRKRFSGYANLQCTLGPPEIFDSKIIRQTQYVVVTNRSLCLHRLRLPATTSRCYMLHGLVCILALLLGIKF